MEIPASAIFSLVMERGLPRVEGLGVWGIRLFSVFGRDCRRFTLLVVDLLLEAF